MAKTRENDNFLYYPNARRPHVIRNYGYCGRDNILELAKKNTDLKENLSVAAHLIHGSSDGRFSIIYATRKLIREEVEGVNFKYRPYEETVKIYDPVTLNDGYNVLPNGETIYYISNSALGLWAQKARFLEG